ncbi:hypothetical protein [Ferroplasma sp.]|uniref:hypothetical protein n=1 Tax=Ferroplasma sp. TaxID=2591003 RepID=UPI00307CD12D
MRNTVYSVGLSSGANYIASLKFSGRLETILTIFPDNYEKYIQLYRKRHLIK